MKGVICPVGHRSGAALGARCGEPLRAEHRGHRCQHRTISEPALNRCPLCRRGLMILDPEEGHVCSFCGATTAPSTTTDPLTP